jgi:tetratricopeptide (TPR) repeat protein
MKFLTRHEAEKYCTDKLDQSIDEEEIRNICSISMEYNLNNIHVLAYKKLVDYYFNNHMYNKCFSCCTELLKFIESIDEKYMLGYTHNFLGACKYMEMEYSEALCYFDKANVYALLYKDDACEIKSLLNSAMCYRRLYWYDKAIEYADLCVVKAKNTGNREKYVYSNMLKINCYADNKDFKSALRLSFEVIDYIEDKEGATAAHFYNNIGNYYVVLEEFDKSLQYFNKSEKVRRLKDIYRLPHTLIDKAYSYIKQSLYYEAEVLLQEGIKEALKNNDLDYALRGYYYLINVYEAQKLIQRIEAVYTDIIELLKKKNPQELKKTYLEISKFYIEQGKLDKADEFMKLSEGEV